MFHASRGRGRLPAVILISLVVLSACGPIPNLQRQPKLKTYADTAFFPDGASARPLAPDTVAREQARINDPMTTGKQNGQPVSQNPVQVNDDVVARGRGRFAIYCAACHGQAGQGDGPVVQKGYKKPPALTDPAVKALPDGQLFDVITNGFNQMPPYGIQIPANDRWAIVAFLRQLQEGK